MPGKTSDIARRRPLSDSLSLAEHLLSRGCLLRRLGRLPEARRLLRRALACAITSGPVRLDALRALATIELESGRFRRARRLLAAAIRQRPSADYLYREYARTVDVDPDADPQLAIRALRAAVCVDPFVPASWALLGTAALRAGDEQLARKALRRAARLRPEESDVLTTIVDGFLALDRDDEARAVVIAARFRSPNDLAVTALRDRIRYTIARRQQRHGGSDEPAILPFPVRERTSNKSPAATQVLRADRRSVPMPHLLRLFGRQTDPRQAQ
jgi:tetratricopeptide (TPR) repeat protein